MGAVKNARTKKYLDNTAGVFDLCKYQVWIKWLKKMRNRVFAGVVIDPTGIIKYALEIHYMSSTLKDTNNARRLCGEPPIRKFRR